MAEERLTFLNLGAVSRPHLFEAARSLIGTAEPRGPALVVAQAAVEVGVETAIDFALQLRDVHDPLREWVGTSMTSWSPTNERVQGLWTALTGDEISAAPGWAAARMNSDAPLEPIELHHARGSADADHLSPQSRECWIRYCPSFPEAPTMHTFIGNSSRPASAYPT